MRAKHDTLSPDRGVAALTDRPKKRGAVRRLTGYARPAEVLEDHYNRLIQALTVLAGKSK